MSNGGVRGLLLFPTEWYLPTTVPNDFHELGDEAFESTLPFDDDNIVKKEWLDDGQVYGGCVFLPCAGYRNCDEWQVEPSVCITLCNDSGFYYSTSSDGEQDVKISDGMVSVYYHYRINEFSVRLVRYL